MNCGLSHKNAVSLKEKLFTTVQAIKELNKIPHHHRNSVELKNKNLSFIYRVPSSIAKQMFRLEIKRGLATIKFQIISWKLLSAVAFKLFLISWEKVSALSSYWIKTTIVCTEVPASFSTNKTRLGHLIGVEEQVSRLVFTSSTSLNETTWLTSLM